MGTIVYGVGTTGKLVVSHLKAMVDASPPRTFGDLRISVIESDTSPPPVFRGDLRVGTEIRHLTALPRTLDMVWQDVRDGRSPTVEAWCFDINRVLGQIAGLDWDGGCRQVRPAGRLALFEHYRQHPGQSILSDGGAISQGDGPNPSWVFVVGSTAGGTGGGIFTDVCRLATEGPERPRVIGLLALPDAFTANFGENKEAEAHARANTAAALREIQRNLGALTHDGGVQYAVPTERPDWRPGDTVGEGVSPAFRDGLRAPLDFCFLVDGLRQSTSGVPLGDRPEIQWDVTRAMAEFIALTSRVDSGPRLRTAVTAGTGRPHTFSRFGLGTVAHPAEELRDYRAHVAAIGLIDQLRGAAPGMVIEAAAIPSNLAEDRRETESRIWGTRHRLLPLLIDPTYQWNGGGNVLVDWDLPQEGQHWWERWRGGPLPRGILQQSTREGQTSLPHVLTVSLQYTEEGRDLLRFREGFRLGGTTASPETGQLVNIQERARDEDYLASCNRIRAMCDRFSALFLDRVRSTLDRGATAAVRNGEGVLDARLAEVLNEPGILPTPPPERQVHARTERSAGRRGLGPALDLMRAVESRLTQLSDWLQRPIEAFKGPKGEERRREILEGRRNQAHERMLGAWDNRAMVIWSLVIAAFYLALWGWSVCRWDLIARFIPIPCAPNIFDFAFNRPGMAEWLRSSEWFILFIYACFCIGTLYALWQAKSRPARQRQYIQRAHELLWFDISDEAFRTLHRISEQLTSSVSQRRETLERTLDRLAKVRDELETRLGGQRQRLQQRPGRLLIGTAGEALQVDTRYGQREGAFTASQALEDVAWVRLVAPVARHLFSIDLFGRSETLGLDAEPFHDRAKDRVAEVLTYVCYDKEELTTNNAKVGDLLISGGRATANSNYYTDDLRQETAWLLRLGGGGTAPQEFLVASDADPLFPLGENVLRSTDPTWASWIRFEHGVLPETWERWGTTHSAYMNWRRDPGRPEVHTTIQSSAAALLEDFSTGTNPLGLPARATPLPLQVLSYISNLDVLKAFAYTWARGELGVGLCQDHDGPFSGLHYLSNPASNDRSNVVGSALRAMANQPTRGEILAKQAGDLRTDVNAWADTLRNASRIPPVIYDDGLLQEWNDVLHRVILIALREQGQNDTKLGGFS